MKTEQTDHESTTFEARLRDGLDHIASLSSDRAPGPFDPELMPLALEDDRGPRVAPLLAVAAVAAVTVAGLVLIGPGEEPARSNPPAPEETSPWGGPAQPAFRFVTPTVRLDAAAVEVVTDAGTFVPSGDVTVDGDPGMPNAYTTLELTWFEHGVEQRINVYFASDGNTWWADEIRTYDGTDRGDWIEPFTTGRFFEAPLGQAYVGDLDLPNLRITDMTLQAFVAPADCDASVGPVALIADYPTIEGRTPGGFGASFQVYDTATCAPLAITDFTFVFRVDDPAVAVVTESGPIGGSAAPDPTSLPGGSAIEEQISAGVDFDEIKTRVGLDFPGPGTTTLHVTATDNATGATIGTVDIPITVTQGDTPDATTPAPPTVPG